MLQIPGLWDWKIRIDGKNYDKKVGFDIKRNIYNINICWSWICPL